MEKEMRLLEWINRGKLPPDGQWEETVVDILRDAGFMVDKVVRKEVRGQWRDQDGPTGETYSMNGSSGIDANNAGATIWLNTIWPKFRYERDADKALALLREAIVRSRPLVPVVISTYGESLGEYPRENVMSEHAKDTDKLSSCVGLHEVCRGWMDLKRVSRTHAAIVCRSCHLRVTFPDTVRTYGDLRTHFADFQPKG